MTPSIVLYKRSLRNNSSNKTDSFLPTEGNDVLLLDVGADPIPIDDLTMTLKAWNKVKDCEIDHDDPASKEVKNIQLGDPYFVQTIKLSENCRIHKTDNFIQSEDGNHFVLPKESSFSILVSDICSTFLLPIIMLDRIEVSIHKKDIPIGLVAFNHSEVYCDNVLIQHVAEEMAHDWEHSSTYENLDLIDGVGAADLIVVNVDALVSMALKKSNGLDWQEHGGQWLHLIWLCEKLLYLLLSRSVNFELVCFKNSILDYENELSAGLYVARMVLFNHLRNNCSFPCFLFDSVYCAEWIQYLDQTNPTAIIDNGSKFSKLYLNSVCLIKYIVTDVEEGAKSVLGDVYSSKYKIRHKKSKTLEKFLKSLTVSNILKIQGEDNLQKMVSEVHTLFESSKFTRIELFLSSFMLMLNGTEESKMQETLFYGLTLAYSILLLDILPLESRHQILNDSVIELRQFIQDLYKYYSIVLNQMIDLKDISIDILDARLAHWILLSFKPSQPFTLNQWAQILREKSPKSVNSTFDLIIDWIKQKKSSELFENVVNIPLNTVECKDLFTYEYENGQCNVLEVKNDFIKDFCNLQSSSIIREEGNSKKPVFQDIYHFHSTRLITDNAEHLDKNKVSSVDKTREKLNGMVNLFKKVNKCKDIATEQLPKDVKSIQQSVDYSSTPTLNVADKKILKLVLEDYRKAQQRLASVKEIIKNQEKLVKSEEVEESISISELVSISLFIQENIELFKPIIDKYRGKTASKNDNTMEIAKNLFIQLLESFKLQLPMSRKPFESKLLQKTLEGPSSKIVLSPMDEQKALYRLYHVNSWIRFIYNFLQELPKLFPFSDKEIKKEVENIITTAKMFGFQETAQLIENPKSKTLTEKDIIDPNYLFLYFFEKTTPTTPQIEIFTKRNHNSILNALITKKNELVEKLKSQKAQKSVVDQLKQLNVQIKLRESLTFIPDEWQNKLIQYVNNDESVLVSVPTSNGKTFIVFYLIEKVLRETENGVVLFVVPNKALVNQVYCEIQSRLKKNQNNIVTAGMATANTRLDVFNSQLLVITPAMLEIYLMSSAPKVLEWRKRIKYLVLDEIHCISGDDQGEYYEHCIQLLDCPIVGLSATLGNAEKFAKWMSHGKRKNIHLIYEPDYKRYNPLEYYNFNGKDFVHTHPCELFNPNYLNEKDIQKCRILTIDECFQLRQGLTEIDDSDEMKEIIESSVGYELLNQNKLACLSWNDHINYKNRYKNLMTSLIKNPQKKEVFTKLVNSFSAKDSFMENENIEIGQFISDMIELIKQMKKKKMLPAIVFILDRRSIDKLVREILELYIDLYEDECPQQDILRISKSLGENDEKSISEYYIRALSKGVGAHYAGMNEGYLIEIERLFREKKLPLIFTTSTLALGIHLPCKTVVIGGSSIYLTNSLFKQCCGRVGRRGIDQKGKVILYGLSKSKIRRYLQSEPITINGTIGLKPSFVLKMFTSLNQAKESKENPFEDAFKRVLEKPLFSINENTMIATQSQMAYFIRFHTEFLRQAMYLSKTCKPLQLSGLINHLHYREPYNFLMAHFLQTGTITQLDINKIPEKEFDKIILTIFTLLFARFKVGKSRKHNRLSTNFSENMSNMYSTMLKENVNFNSEVLRIYSNYAIAYCTSENVKDTTLPLSEIDFTLLFNVEEEITECEIYKLLDKARSKHVTSISTYAAMSGNQERRYQVQS